MKDRLKARREARARRAAKRVGLVARKSRQALGLDNHGGFGLLDPSTNLLVLGWRFDLEPEEVVEFCEEYDQGSDELRLVQ